MPTCFGAIHRIESDPNCNFSRLYSLRVKHKISRVRFGLKFMVGSPIAQFRTQRRGSNRILLQP